MDDMITITKGEKAFFTIYVVTNDEHELPINITDYTKLKVSILKTDDEYLLLSETDSGGSIVAKKTPNELGAIEVTIMPDKTNLLKESDALDIDVELDEASPAPLRRRLVKVLQVVGSSIPVA